MVLVTVGSATSLNCQIRAPNNHTLSRSIFPHLRKPSCKVYSLIPGPPCYKRAEDPGLFSLQSLSLLIRETQTLEDNSRLGRVKGRRKRMIMKIESGSGTGGRIIWRRGKGNFQTENSTERNKSAA